MEWTVHDLAKMIDHSLLNPTMTDKDLDEGIDIALKYDTASVCIKPYALKHCAQRLKGSDVQPSTTIGFPHGGHLTNIKVAEAEQALADGGTELDMVCNIGKVLSGEWNFVSDDIAAVTEVVHKGGAIVKVIFENCYLNDEQKIKLCEICGKIGVDFVKTSTGYGMPKDDRPTGATVEDIRLMRAHSPARVRVKAAGGVRTLEALLAVREAGAVRCGATRTIGMLEAAKKAKSEG